MREPVIKSESVIGVSSSAPEFRHCEKNTDIFDLVLDKNCSSLDTASAGKTLPGRFSVSNVRLSSSLLLSLFAATTLTIAVGCGGTGASPDAGDARVDGGSGGRADAGTGGSTGGGGSTGSGGRVGTGGATGGGGGGGRAGTGGATGGGGGGGTTVAGTGGMVGTGGATG